MDYKRIYEVLKYCDSNGKIMHSEHREGVQNLLSPQESKKSLELAVNSWKTRTTHQR